MALEVVAPGLACSVQDLGRPGHYAVGIPPSGAVDLRSAVAANLLVGNDEGAALLEIPYMGPVLRSTEPSVIAATGASMLLRVNGQDVPQWESVAVAAGDEVSFGYLQSGARVYLAVAGGIAVPPVLGSRSTYGLGAFGGHEGRTVQTGDLLPVGSPAPTARDGRVVPEHLRPQHPRDLDIRVVLGLYDYRLAPEGLALFLDATWTLSTVADRTGFRYQGPTLAWQDRVQPFGAGSDPSNIVDAGYPVGSIQVPGGVEPIVLHRDAVSGGGYASVATVISADMDAVGQCAPGARTRFRDVSLHTALDARRHRAEQVRALRRALQQP